MELRAYREGDGPILAALFYDTVHTVNAKDYTPEQLAAWAPAGRDLKAWDRSFRDHITLVAEEQGMTVGFADLDAAAGYLDRLYVHRSFQRRGVATALCAALEACALDCGAKRIETHASITARPFFAQRGYRVVREQRVCRKDVLLTNFIMEKILREN